MLGEEIAAARAEVDRFDERVDLVETGEKRSFIAEGFKARRRLLGLVVREALGDTDEAREFAVRLVAGVRSAKLGLTQIDAITDYVSARRGRGLPSSTYAGVAR